MASLKRRRSRKPAVAEGACYTGSSVRWSESDGQGMVHALGTDYTLTVFSRGNDGAEFEIRLTEDEMLHTVTAWLSEYRRIRNAETRKVDDLKS